MGATNKQQQAYGQWVTAPVTKMVPQRMPQGHPGISGINEATAGTTQMAATIVVLPPGQFAHCHTHPHHESIIFILEGYGVTFMGPDAEPTFQRAGDFLFIPKGVAHMPINLSTSERFVALTTRADAKLNEHMQMEPAVEEKCIAQAKKLQAKFANGTLQVDWEKGYHGGEPFEFPAWSMKV